MISRFCFGGKERKNIMGLLTFKGGIHPDDGKRFSKDSEIRTLLPKGELAYPLSQHIGAPANPIVKKGDHVFVPAGLNRYSIPFTVPDTEAWIGDDTKPPASAIFCPFKT